MIDPAANPCWCRSVRITVPKGSPKPRGFVTVACSSCGMTMVSVPEVEGEPPTFARGWYEVKPMPRSKP